MQPTYGSTRQICKDNRQELCCHLSLLSSNRKENETPSHVGEVCFQKKKNSLKNEIYILQKCIVKFTLIQSEDSDIVRLVFFFFFKASIFGYKSHTIIPIFFSYSSYFKTIVNLWEKEWRDTIFQVQQACLFTVSIIENFGFPGPGHSLTTLLLMHTVDNNINIWGIKPRFPDHQIDPHQVPSQQRLSQTKMHLWGFYHEVMDDTQAECVTFASNITRFDNCSKI